MTRKKHRTHSKVPKKDLVTYGGKELIAVRVRCGGCSRQVGYLGIHAEDCMVHVYGSNWEHIPAGDVLRMNLPECDPHYLRPRDRLEFPAQHLPVGWYFVCRRCDHVGFLQGETSPGSYGAAEALAAHRAEMRIQTLVAKALPEDPSWPPDSAELKARRAESGGKWMSLYSASSRRRRPPSSL